MNFYNKKHEDDVYILYRDLGHCTDIKKVEVLLNNLDPHTLKLLIAIKLGFGYQIKEYKEEEIERR